MWRKIHTYIALACGLLLLVSALSGVILATRPVVQVWQLHQPLAHRSVADILQLLAEKNPRAEVNSLSILPSGAIKVDYSIHNKGRQGLLNLTTGKIDRLPEESDFYLWVNKLHRQFFLGEKGRWISAFNGLVMFSLIISGLILLVRRVGGIRRLLSRQSWQGAGGLHAGLARWVLIPLVITALTSLWLSAVTLHLAPTGDETPPHYPESLKELDPVPAWTLHTLKAIPMSEVKSVTFPVPEDWFDIWTVKTGSRYIFVDQFTGDELRHEELPWSAKVYSWVRLLHTAEGAWFWGLILLIGVASVPVFLVTGIMVWLKRKRNEGRIVNNQSASQARVLILIGSENGTTWGFGRAVQLALDQAGIATRITEMNQFETCYPKLETLLVLASTYEDGDAPSNANHFLSKLEKYTGQKLKHATLAFGDRSFTHFAGFGLLVASQLKERFGEPCLPTVCVDKANAQTFEQWCRQLGEYLDKELNVKYQPISVKTKMLAIQEKLVFGRELNAPYALFRMTSAKHIPKLQPGDYISIYAPNTTAPRLYSLASDTRKDGFVDICVRLQEGGACSTWLHSLGVGDIVNARGTTNENFHLPEQAPIVLMVSAGTGIAPFIGMIRHANAEKQALHLYWGARCPDSDKLYADEIAQWQKTGQLKSFNPAWSRIENGSYIQDKILADAHLWQDYIKNGAVIMICGGLNMAQAVQEVINTIIQDQGLSIEILKQQKRYFEDVY